MLNVLLMSSEGIRLCLEYGLCLLIIVAALIAIGFLKRKTKKEMRAETEKQRAQMQKNIKLYRTLGFSAGAAILILVI